MDRETTSSERDRITKLTANPTKEAALLLFVEQLFYEQSAARTVREQQEKRSCGWSRQPLKIEQLPDREMTDRARERRVVLALLGT